jgi:periplasmic mercuric ion binding protein
MKKLTLISTLTLLAFLVHFTARAQEAGPAVKISVVKITTSAECEMCKKRIEKEVSLLKGVKKAELDLTTKVLTVEYNGKKTSPDKIRTAIANLGYDADNVKANNRATKQLPHCCQPGADSAH